MHKPEPVLEIKRTKLSVTLYVNESPNLDVVLPHPTARIHIQIYAGT